MATENYTEEQTKALLEAYALDKDISKLEAEFKRTRKSLIAKLVREKVYVAQATSQKQRTETKADLAKFISDHIGAENYLESLEKCSKADLFALANHFREMVK